MADELWQRSACELAQGIPQRKFSCREVMESVAGRIRAKNGALNAIVYDYTEEALAEARRADEELASGRVRGPLHGVPVTIKENVDQQGKPTPNGVPAFETVIAPDDAPVVANLRRAGAIIVGRTNTPELSMRATTDNPLHGRTLNPWHPDASPGGSSGGAGAAAAAGFGPIHHGNDIGGSLRFPAFACGAGHGEADARPHPRLQSVGHGRARHARPAHVGAGRDLPRGARRAAGHAGDGRARRPRSLVGAGAVRRRAPPAPIRVAVTRNAHGYPMHPDIGRALEQRGRLAGRGGLRGGGGRAAAHHRARARLVLRGRRRDEGDAVPAGAAARQPDHPGHLRLVRADGERRRRARLHAGHGRTDAHDPPVEHVPRAAPAGAHAVLHASLYPWNYDAQGFAQTKDLFDAAIYSYGVNYLGLPAGVVPVGLVEGLPAGVQIVGRRFREDLILDAMAAVEAQAGVLTRTLWARE